MTWPMNNPSGVLDKADGKNGKITRTDGHRRKSRYRVHHDERNKFVSFRVRNGCAWHTGDGIIRNLSKNC